ncbi:hypothetical protein SDC9_203011 [bioreactor metagenome]|uniref:Uncharacterized protein n=1 Tax=bioreactor metagenome TaxID=1076179 RepID=A0A645IY19_9ZZZZ
MRGNIKLFSLCITVAVCVFFVSFACTVRFIIKPRYEMMSSEGVFDKIRTLQDTVMQKEAKISALEEEIAIYQEYYNNEKR